MEGKIGKAFCFWDEIKPGEHFFSWHNDKIMIYGMKISDYRYFCYKNKRVFGFSDNKKPGYKSADFHFEKVADPVFALKRQIHYLYNNAPESLKNDFDRDFPNNERLNELIK